MNLMAILLMIHRIIVKDAAIGIYQGEWLVSINFILSYRVLTTMTHTEEHGCWKWSIFVMTVLSMMMLSYAQNTSCLINWLSFADEPIRIVQQLVDIDKDFCRTTANNWTRKFQFSYAVDNDYVKDKMHHIAA